MNPWRIVGGVIAYLIAAFLMACAVGARLHKQSADVPLTEDAVPLSRALLCLECNSISDATGEACPKCQSAGSFLPLHRVLNPTPELGTINFVCKG